MGGASGGSTSAVRLGPHGFSKCLCWTILDCVHELFFVFGLSQCLCGGSALLVCKATSSTSSTLEPILKLSAVLHQCDHGLSAPFRAGLPSGHFAGSWLGAWTSVAPLLCSAWLDMSARPSLAVPASWRRNRDLCFFSLCSVLFSLCQSCTSCLLCSCPDCLCTCTVLDCGTRSAWHA